DRAWRAPRRASPGLSPGRAVSPAPPGRAAARRAQPAAAGPAPAAVRPGRTAASRPRDSAAPDRARRQPVLRSARSPGVFYASREAFHEGRIEPFIVRVGREHILVPNYARSVFRRRWRVDAPESLREGGRWNSRSLFASNLVRNRLKGVANLQARELERRSSRHREV